MKGKKNRIIVVLLMAIVFVAQITVVSFADSGYSTLPQDTPLQKYCYKYIAPKKQTNYKAMYTTTIPVAKLKKQTKKIMAVSQAAGDIGSGYGVAGVVVKRLPYTAEIGAVTFVGGKVVYKVCNDSLTSLDKLKKNTKQKTVVYYKWTDAKRLKYSVKIVDYFVYKGTKVGKSRVRYVTGQWQ